MVEPTSHTLEVPGAVLTYDARRNGSSADPILLVIGSPMGAAGFGTLAQHFTDRTVVTYDPRGSERSKRTDGATQNTVEGMRTTCIGSSPRSMPGRSTSSPAAAARRTRWLWSPSSRRTPSLQLLRHGLDPLSTEPRLRVLTESRVRSLG